MVAAMRWFGLALLGILIAAAVSVAASRLASQQIGLASEPISAGDALAPAAKEKPKPRLRHHDHGQQTTPSPSPPVTTSPPTTEPITPEPSEAPPLSGEPQQPGGNEGDRGGAADD